MKISHIFHHFNEFGGAEEHIVTLAELQKNSGHTVGVFLIQAADHRNQYYRRLKLAGVKVNQWPLWISRLSGDWDTRESIIKNAVFVLTPLIFTVVWMMTILTARSRNELRTSAEGRIRTTVGKMMDLQREKRLFLLMLRWKYFIDRPDVIHFHSYGAGLEYVLQWANLHKFPTVYQEHSTPDLTKRDWYSLPTDLNKASIVVAVSEASAKALIHLCDVHRPIRIIPPIASIKFNGNHEKRCFCPDKKNIQIITLSRLSEEKGLSYLIDAAEMVLPERASITFNIYGEGPLRASLEDMIKNKKLAEHVFLRGKYTRDKLNEIMRDADIYLLPSVTEGLPLALIEAMAWGLPIVATGVGGIPELIEDGTSGLLCEPKNSTSLAQAIISLIKDPPLALKLGTIAQDIYQEKFTAEHILGQFDEAYFQALKN